MSADLKILSFIFYEKTKNQFVLFEDAKNGILQGPILESDSNAATLAGARILLSELYPELTGEMIVGQQKIQGAHNDHKQKQIDLHEDWTSLWTHTQYYELQEFLCNTDIYNKDDLSSFTFVIFLSEIGVENLKQLRKVLMVESEEITELFYNEGLIDNDVYDDSGLEGIIETIESFSKQQGTRQDTYILFVNKEADREKYVPGRPFVPVHAIYKGVFKRKFEHWHTFNVAKHELPSDDLLENARSIIVPGSSANAWEDRQWVQNLKLFLHKAHSSFPHIRLVGICFGFQIIARTFGGSVRQLEARKKDPHFHVIGNEKIEVNQHFSQELFVRDFLPAHSQVLHINKGHGDIVTELPLDFFLHMGSSRTAHNELALSKDRRILCFQGHPEYAYEYSRRLMATFSSCQGKTKNDWNCYMTSPEFIELFNKPNDHSLLIKIINNFIRH